MKTQVKEFLELIKTADTWENEDGEPRFPDPEDIPRILRNYGNIVESYINELLAEIEKLKSK